jgi:hypothetical protein
VLVGFDAEEDGHSPTFGIRDEPLLVAKTWLHVERQSSDTVCNRQPMMLVVETLYEASGLSDTRHVTLRLWRRGLAPRHHLADSWAAHRRARR